MARKRYKRRLPVPTHCWACGREIEFERNDRQGPPMIVCGKRECISARHRWTNRTPRELRAA